jgi:hypothetical protein
MISDAEEFVSLRTSGAPKDYLKAANESAATSVWRDILQRHPDMHFWVAQNKTIPLEILVVLTKSEDAKVRAMVAMKGRLTSELFNILANDPDASVRQRIAYNKKAPKEVLEKLANDKDLLVSSVARDRIREQF